MKKIYVGNLPWATTDDDLRQLFATYGEVQSSAVVNDRDSEMPLLKGTLVKIARIEELVGRPGALTP